MFNASRSLDARARKSKFSPSVKYESIKVLYCMLLDQALSRCFVDLSLTLTITLVYTKPMAEKGRAMRLNHDVCY